MIVLKNYYIHGIHVRSHPHVKNLRKETPLCDASLARGRNLAAPQTSNSRQLGRTLPVCAGESVFPFQP